MPVGIGQECADVVRDFTERVEALRQVGGNLTVRIVARHNRIEFVDYEKVERQFYGQQVKTGNGKGR